MVLSEYMKKWHILVLGLTLGIIGFILGFLENGPRG